MAKSIFTKSQKELLSSKIQTEGFDYCFMDYSSFEEIKDEQFRVRLKRWEDARKDFCDYLKENGVDPQA